MRHFRRAGMTTLWLACLGVLACSEDGASSTLDAATADAGTPIDADPTFDGDGTPRGIVVVHSDYHSSSVSFLDRNGTLVKDGCLTSGTGTPELSMTLSQDLALPSPMPPDSPVVIIDRGNATLIWLDPRTCAPLQQISVGTGFAANPHDYVQVSADKAYVPRYKANTTATPAPEDLDDGDDLLIVNPSQASLVGRIALAPFAPTGFLPRADRALLIEGMVYLSLNLSDAKFDTYAAGRLLVVDPTQDKVVTVIDLPGTKNCGAMTYLSEEHKLLVACTGDYSPSADGSAVVVLDMTASPPAIAAVLSTALVAGHAFSNASLAALDGNTIFAVTLGDFSKTPPDELWLLSQGGHPGEMLFSTSEPFVLGALLLDSERGRLFVTDGTKQKPAMLRIFERANGVFQETAQVKTNPTQKLPPRGLAWF